MAEEKVETTATATDFDVSLTRMEQFAEQNRNAVMIGAGVVVAIAAALIFLFVKYLPDQNLKAQKEMYNAEFAFARDSFAVALNGGSVNNGGVAPTPYKGFAEVAKKYSWTKAGNLANYYAGICCLNLKKYDEAINYLDKFSTKDPIIGAMKLNATGDAYAETGKTDEAIKYYQKAADFSDNEKYTPYFLLKAGMAYEHQKKNEDAKKCYEKIRAKYPNSDEGRQIDMYIARVGGSLN